MLAGASDVVGDISTGVLVVDVVAWAEETEDDIEENCWVADDADEELYRSVHELPF